MGVGGVLALHVSFPLAFYTPILLLFLLLIFLPFASESVHSASTPICFDSAKLSTFKEHVKYTSDVVIDHNYEFVVNC
jgi:hypothetical protein